MLTNQEAFDRAAKHCIEQGVCALNDEMQCAYRADMDGVIRKCAVGCMIPDKDYKPRFEGIDASEVACHLPHIFENVSCLLLIDIQRAHDSELKKGVRSFRQQMRAVAISYGLKPDILDQTDHEAS